jgi:hypothetical protein
MTNEAKLEAEFDEDIRQILVKEKEVGCNSTRFRQMLEQHGGLKASHRLLEPDRQFPKGTFSALRNMGRPDLTLEHYVLLEKYQPLFSEEERRVARFRLDFED